jgi:hypothetical protein
MIPLRPVDSSNYRERIELAVAPDQERFVASNVQSLAEAYVWREGTEPFAVYSDGAVVGFALLFPLGAGEPDGSVPPDGTVRGFILVRVLLPQRLRRNGRATRGRDCRGTPGVAELPPLGGATANSCHVRDRARSGMCTT